MRLSAAGIAMLFATLTVATVPAQTPSQPASARFEVGAPVGDGTGTSIFTAIQEQPELKVESTRGPVAVVVVDAAQHPAPD